MRRHTWAAVPLAATLVLPTVAAAQSAVTADDATRADALFSAAKKLRDAGQYTDACPLFAESQRLAPGIGVTLYLADCHERTGNTARAWREFHEAERLAEERHDARRAEVARARAQALEPKLSDLTVALPSGAAQRGWQVLLDGTRLPPEQWNVMVPVDPGDHVVTVTAPGEAARTLGAHVAVGDRTTVVRVARSASTSPASSGGPLPAPPAASPSGGAAESEPEGAATTAEASGWSWSEARPWIELGLLGVGAAGVGLGAAFLVHKNESMNNGTVCDPPSEDAAASTASAVAFTAGGVAIAAAIVLYLTTPVQKTSGFLMTPTMMAGGGGGALLRTTF